MEGMPKDVEAKVSVLKDILKRLYAVMATKKKKPGEEMELEVGEGNPLEGAESEAKEELMSPEAEAQGEEGGFNLKDILREEEAKRKSGMPKKLGLMTMSVETKKPKFGKK